MTLAVAGLAGAALGILAGWWLLRRSSDDRAEALFERWRAEEAEEVARAAAAEERRDTKAGSGAQLPGLPGPAADARFIGDPVHLIVFDGDSDLKAGAVHELRSVEFVTFGDSADADLVEECVAAGRVRWETLRIPTGSAPSRGYDSAIPPA